MKKPFVRVPREDEGAPVRLRFKSTSPTIKLVHWNMDRCEFVACKKSSYCGECWSGNRIMQRYRLDVLVEDKTHILDLPIGGWRQVRELLGIYTVDDFLRTDFRVHRTGEGMETGYVYRPDIFRKVAS